jgi:hypothetical protein
MHLLIISFHNYLLRINTVLSAIKKQDSKLFLAIKDLGDIEERASISFVILKSFLDMFEPQFPISKVM